MQVSQWYLQMETQASSSGGFIGNTVDNPKNEKCMAIELRNRVISSKSINGKEKNLSNEVGNTKGK